MQKFDLPMVRANISAHSALKKAIHAGRSGVVVKTGAGGLRLVHYKGLVSAARNKTPIGKIDYVTILKVGGKDTTAIHLDQVRAAGLKFGYLGAKGDLASLLSVRETFAKRYLAASGSRCTRPNKPPGTADQAWYHYYPPERRGAKHPDLCKICGYKIA